MVLQWCVAVLCCTRSRHPWFWYVLQYCVDNMCGFISCVCCSCTLQYYVAAVCCSSVLQECVVVVCCSSVLYREVSCGSVTLWVVSFPGILVMIHMWHDSFIRATWLIIRCDMTHSYAWHDSSIGVTGGPFICVTWLIHTCDMAHSYVWHGSFIFVTCQEFLVRNGRHGCLFAIRNSQKSSRYSIDNRE